MLTTIVEHLEPNGLGVLLPSVVCGIGLPLWNPSPETTTCTTGQDWVSLVDLKNVLSKIDTLGALVAMDAKLA